VVLPRTFVQHLPVGYFGLSRSEGQSTTSWRALRNRSFRYYFVGSVTSDFGTWLQNTAQVLLAYRLSHSVLVVGLVTCAQFSSPLVLGPWAGVMTDKFGGRPILLATQLTAATFAGLMAGLAFAGDMHTRWLGCGAIASGLAFTFALPARNVTVRRLVSPGDIRSAFAMDSVSYNLGRAIAPPISVLLITTLGYGWAFAANSASFLVFAGCLVLAGQGQPTERRERSQIRDGFKVAFHDWRIAVLLLMVAAITVADDPVLVLGPALAGHLHVNPSWSGWFIAALGGGTVAGSVLPQKHTPSVRLAATALAALAASMILFVLSPWVWGCFFAAFGAGVSCLIANSATRTELATRAGPASEACVMAVWAIAWAGSKPFASLSDGLLASRIGIKWTGVLLATPALVPVVVLIALAVLVVMARKWNPPEGRRDAQALDTLRKFPWIRRAEELLVIAPQAEIIEETPIGTRSGQMTVMGLLSHNRFWRNGGPCPHHVPSGRGAREDRRNAEPGGSRGQIPLPSVNPVPLRALRPHHARIALVAQRPVPPLS
jgi:predicted MFS family arabinose efflux permease